MKRDLELVRKLLIYLEEKQDPAHRQSADIQIEGYSHAEIGYHLRLLFQAGFIHGEAIRSSSSERLIDVIPFQLTWDAHEFLDASRNDKVWKKVARQAGQNIGSIPFEILKALLLAEARRQVGLES
tara:strand:+ start:1590 stop:1967 length:378 start_codon:yes stop_codon:yes gene_type:complete